MFLACSYFVLTTIVIEWILLAMIGAIRIQLLMGSAFYMIHLVCFFVGPPALVNALVLPDSLKYYARWLCAIPVSTALAFILVVQQYAVSEALFGID